jgi:hypothetical protein
MVNCLGQCFAYCLLLPSLCGLNLQLDLLAAGITSHNLSVELEVNPLLLQNLL